MEEIFGSEAWKKVEEHRLKKLQEMTTEEREKIIEKFNKLADIEFHKDPRGDNNPPIKIGYNFDSVETDETRIMLSDIDDFKMDNGEYYNPEKCDGIYLSIHYGGYFDYEDIFGYENIMACLESAELSLYGIYSPEHHFTDGFIYGEKGEKEDQILQEINSSLKTLEDRNFLSHPYPDSNYKSMKFSTDVDLSYDIELSPLYLPIMRLKIYGERLKFLPPLIFTDPNLIHQALLPLTFLKKP